MAMFNRVQVGLKPTSERADVPNNDVAKLMYYLNSMCSVLKLDDNADINRLRNYSNWAYLTHTDRNVLLHLCLLLEPKLLLNKCIFQNDALCGNFSNAFYDLEAVSSSLVAAGSVVIGGQRKQVTKIMTFTMSWLNNNWVEPMKGLAARQERERREMMAASQRGQSCVIL